MRLFVLSLSALVLSACGSGGGSSNMGSVGSGGNASVAAALSAIAAAPTGWATACSGGYTYIVYASGAEFTIEQQSRGGNCANTENNIRYRTTFTSGSATVNGALVSMDSPVITKISYAAANSSVASDMNLAGSSTGVCSKNNWSPGTWVDVSSTICWNYATAPSSGPGYSAPTTPVVYNHTVSAITFTVSGNTMTDNAGHTYTKF